MRDELENTHEIARRNLAKASLRQTEYYDRIFKEINYSAGDLVRRWQPQFIKGAKRKLPKNWTGPWVITETLTKVLFRIEHSKNSPAFIIHADTLKPNREETSVTWYKPITTVLDAPLPYLNYFSDDDRNDVTLHKVPEIPRNTDEVPSEKECKRNTLKQQDKYRNRVKTTDGSAEPTGSSEPSDISEGEFDNSVTPEHIENTEQDADHSEGILNIDDFMDYLDTEDILDMNNNSVIVDETTKTITLEIKKKTTTLADGTVEVTRDSLIAYSVNMEINVADIVEEVTSVVNNYLHNKCEAKRQDIWTCL
ncbi:unnamed protein product [Mytilus edulis]|uniref:Uncharacterized protein n=1 Tax=Mytilus edulis TaxID=6550 RepID=A0A8S3V2Q4_MYTED|nr:unnamed protein product [Mytilus edulis]